MQKILVVLSVYAIASCIAYIDIKYLIWRDKRRDRQRDKRDKKK